MNCKVHYTEANGDVQMVEFTGAAEHHVESFVFAVLARGCTKVKVEVLGY